MDLIPGDPDAGATLLLLPAVEMIKECNIKCAIDAMSHVSRLLVITTTRLSTFVDRIIENTVSS